MIKILNNILKGLMVSLVIITILGFTTLDITPITPNTLILVSSSMINSLTTSEEKEDVKEEIEVFEELSDDTKLEIKEEIEESNDKNNQETSDKKEEIKVEENTPSQVIEPEKPQEIVIQGVYSPNLEVANTYSAIETYHGKMTGYGPDCVGCSGITASGMNVLNGNIYYNDKTFGNIRIVAGDRSIPFGSIIRITGVNISSDPVLAIVLDRGGMIGFEEWKHSYFDLLYESEGAASSFGRQNATFELLRRGY